MQATIKKKPAINPHPGQPIHTKSQGQEPSSSSFNLGRKLFSLIPAAIATGFVVDTYKGQRYDTEAQISQQSVERDWKIMEEKQGHWSGYPWMDMKSDQFKEFILYGPLNLRQKWENAKTYTDNFLNRVLAPNAIPITFGIISLYIGFGRKTMHAPFRAIRRMLTHSSIPPEFKRKLGRAIANGFRAVGRGISRLSALPFKSLHHFGFTIAGAGLLAFALGRFQDVYSNQAEEDFFRDSLFNERR